MCDGGFLDIDLMAILEGPGFAEEMLYAPGVEEAPKAFRGIFNAPTGERNPGNSSAPVLAQNYSVICRAADLPVALKRGANIFARGQMWRVYEHFVDGQGMLTIFLQKGE